MDKETRLLDLLELSLAEARSIGDLKTFTLLNDLKNNHMVCSQIGKDKTHDETISVLKDYLEYLRQCT